MVKYFKHGYNKLKGDVNFNMSPKYFVFLVFLGISSVMWFFNALSRSYTTDIVFPVEYFNAPDNKVLTDDGPQEIMLTVESDGYTLLKKKYFNREVPILDIRALNYNKVSATTDKYFILGKDVGEIILREFEENISLKGIQPDTILFNFEDKATKRVPIKPNIEIEFENQFNVRGEIISSPDSIDISGSKSVIDSIKYIETQLVNLSAISANTELEADLEKQKKIHYSQRKVKLTIPVDRYTESNISASIKVQNIPDSLVLRVFPKNVNISFLVALQDFDKTNESQFDVFVNYEEIESSSSSLRVYLDKYPTFIKTPVFKPKTVQFLIEKK